MDIPTSAWPAGVTAGDEVLDETDPHAGDDADWEDDELAAAIILAALEPSPLLFWKGLLLGLLFSAAAWCAVAAVVFALYRLVTYP